MKINVGILGFAHNHVNAYCTQWTQNPEYQINVVAAWDHDPARLAKNAAAFNLQPYDDVDAFLAHPEMQALVIAAETSMHAELVERAAAAHKMIALQKPIALTMAEADRIVAAVAQHNVPFTLAWQMRVDPQNIAMKELIASGELGKLFMVRRRHGLPAQIMDIKSMWQFDPALNRDIWADDSSHPIDMIQWLLGAPETITAELTSNYIPEIPNANGIVLFRYADGLLAEVNCSFSCLAAENTTEVIGEKGSIVQNYGDVPSCNVPRPADAVGLKWYTAEKKDWTNSEIATPALHSARIAGLSGPLADFFHGRRPPIATAEEGRMSLRMTLACYVSNREGRRVSINDERILEV